MRKSLMKLLGVVAALVLSLPAAAVGMGGISVSSALGQPLRADIELMSVGRVEKSSLVARIASPDAYRGAGLEYPFGNKFSFQVENRANGDAYLRVSSAQPVNDPFVSLLVELSWASGRLLREYTFLLDPPGYVPVQEADIAPQVLAPMPAAPAFVEPAPAPAPAPAPDETRQPEAAEEAAQKQAPAMRATAPADEGASSSAAPSRSAPAPLAAQPPQRSQPAGTGAADITVKRGDTLSAIAERNRPVDVSLERMLVALYRANADQFDGRNMNRIRTGKILRLPDQNELQAVKQSEAAQEIRVQSADWHAYRQRLASAAPVSSRPLEAQQTIAGKITSSLTDKTPVARESSKEVLKLSKGETPGDRAAAGESGSATGAQEDAIAKAKTLKEEQERLALLEQNLKDMQRLGELKSEAAALAQQAASGVMAESAVAAASAAEPVKAAKPKPVAAPPAPEPSVLDQILAEPLYLAGGAIALLALGGLGLMLARRKQAFVASPVVQPRDAATTARIATPVAPSPDTGDFTGVANVAGGDAAHSDDVDPISEADLFLNFGRDAQAEEILKEALLNTPGDHRIHLKLLGIYANRKDVNAFAAVARQLQNSGDGEAWEQAAAMGRKLEPGNPMYGGGGMIEDADGAAVRAPAFSPEPDFVLESAEPEAAAAAPDLDFDLGLPVAGQEADFQSDAGKTVVLSAQDAAAAQVEAMDFDVTSIDSSAPGSASTAGPAAMDFDVTSSSPSSSLPELEMPDAGAAEPERDVAPARQDAALPSLDDLIFDVTLAAPATASASEAHETEQPGTEQPAHAADDALAFTLDFPAADEAEKPAKRDDEMGLAGINLNLDDVGAPGEAPEEEHDEHWHEVATKLDLAKAYQEMGDVTGAREILEEVLLEGDAAQQETAQSILDQLL